MDSIERFDLTAFNDTFVGDGNDHTVYAGQSADTLTVRKSVGGEEVAAADDMSPQRIGLIRIWRKSGRLRAPSVVG